jgi:hypothetical protein
MAGLSGRVRGEAKMMGERRGAKAAGMGLS